MTIQSGAKALLEKPGKIHVRARHAMSILLGLANFAHQSITYKALDQAIAQKLHEQPKKGWQFYGEVLEIVGQALNRLSEEWGEEIPPLTILVVNKSTGLPGAGVKGFLKRYVQKERNHALTSHNRTALIEYATQAVYNYPRWKDVAAYFDLDFELPKQPDEVVKLPLPITIRGEESQEHRNIKNYVANHPELFQKIGNFEKGQTEHRLYSGDEVDVFFENNDQALAAEVKTSSAAPGEITRGIFQCEKYRAVLRAMYTVNRSLHNVACILVTPQVLSQIHQDTLQILEIQWMSIPKESEASG